MKIDIDLLKHEVTTAAADELMPRFQKIDCASKADGSLVTEADLAVQERLSRSLKQAYPQIALLGEEMSADQQQQIMQKAGEGFWCLDPLDGTANYVAGMPCFATSLAYIRGGRVEIGVIYDPLRDECFHAIKDQGAWLNDKPLQLNCTIEDLNACVAMVDFKRLSSTLAGQLATQPPYRSQRSIGSVALDWCWLAAGRLQLYLHGGSKLWDYAAGSLIYSEAGGHYRLTSGAASLAATEKLGLSPQMAIAAPNQSLFEAWQDYLCRYD
jgi:myo-inositol-1(or 4)-monophosphatase